MPTYPGGKAANGVYQAIINELPPHETYIEAFAGGAAIARYKRPADHTILIDRHAPALAAITPFAASIGAALIHGCALEYLSTRQWTGRELVYLDPPYVRSSRRSARDLYEHELTDDDHIRLLSIARRIPAPVAISGYASDLYENALSDWRKISFQAPTRGGKYATEILWMSYPKPPALHDYRYVGADYRERERIRKMANRHRARLASLPAHERLAILSALLQVPVHDDPLASIPARSVGDGRHSPPEMAV